MKTARVPPATNLRPTPLALLLAALLGACASPATRPGVAPAPLAYLVQDHRDGDDLLTAGLGAAGLRSPVPPAFADPAQPTAAERRRRALWVNWRGIADLAPGGGYGEVYGSLAPVPGREYHALATLPGANQPHRVMVQVPDGFDPGGSAVVGGTDAGAIASRCVVVAASSGSRGIHGAIALAGAWGLPRGCAVAYTDKGAGTGYVDTGVGGGVRLDGSLAVPGEVVEFAMALPAPSAMATAGGASAVAPIAVKHAHSGDHPEADWGRHVRQAAEFALQVLAEAHPEGAPYTHANTRVVAVGVSNGGGAVLRAAELEGGWLDGVVAISPNIWAGEGGRALYDYATEAALWMPCALTAPDFDAVALARPAGVPSPAGRLRCASLHGRGLLRSDSPAGQSAEALAWLRARGWSDPALAAGALSTGFDLWRAVAVTYASSYLRRGPADMPCGYAFHALDGNRLPRPSTAAERAAWGSDAAGIPPGAGVFLIDGLAAGEDAALPGLLCLRELWEGEGGDAAALRTAVAATRAALPSPGLPVLVVHGVDDGLVPEAFSGGAYGLWARVQGRGLRYWRVRNAQHFDAFLGLPPLAARYLPLMPYAYQALDAMWAHVAHGRALPADADIATSPRRVDGATVSPLRSSDLGTIPGPPPPAR